MRKKAVERARKAEEKAKKTATRRGKQPSRRAANILPSSLDSASSSGLAVQPLPKRRRKDVGTDECCMCFGNYEDVAEGLGTE